MGRRNNRYNTFAQKKREKKEKVVNNTNNDRRQPSYDDIIRENVDFEKYYKMQKICPENEWDKFLQAIKCDLPTAFRITGSREEAKALLNIVKSQFFKNLIEANDDPEKKDDITEWKPFSLPWYPDELAWQLKLTRKDIRRSETYFKLHNFLISETNSGNISRQEAVSMIPPIALDVKSNHKILDMCAAPGSKTAQLIEMLHQTTSTSDEIPKGFVIANDSDNNRCYMLVHQAKRLNSPCTLVVNHDATVFPNLTISEHLVNDNVTSDQTQRVPLKYDRILCDVPCSGDGTLRKNPDIWLKWNAANGNNLHGIQSRIIRRGAELLAVGGRLVYSTCSLNPIENEAVIHRLLNECEGSLKLIDPRPLLPQLKHQNGMTYWLPASKDLQFYEKFEDVPEKWHTVVRPQMFPPKPEDLDKFELHKCMRILPHQQDTGGFFIAVIEKVNFLPWETIARSESDINEIPIVEQHVRDNEKPPPRKKRRIYGYKEDPFVFFKDDEQVWPSIKEFYDINSNFDPKCLLTRCHVGKKKNIYFCSQAIRDIVINNEIKLKIINTGVKTFVRCDNKNMQCAFRLGNEGLLGILPFFGPKRIITIEKSDLITILHHDNPMDPPDITTLTESTQQQVANITPGSCTLKYIDDDLKLQLCLSGWKGARSLRAYVTKFDTIHILRLLGEDTSKYDVNKFKKNENENDEIETNINNDEEKAENMNDEELEKNENIENLKD